MCDNHIRIFLFCGWAGEGERQGNGSVRFSRANYSSPL